MPGVTRPCRAAPDEGQAGFTLIELLVVVIIMGILADITIPVFLNQRNKAYDSAAKSEMHTALIAFETYFTDNQTFPQDAPPMQALEPSITWVTSYGYNTPNPPAESLNFEWAQGGSHSSVVMTVRSRSNRCFYQRIVEDLSMSPQGVTYLTGGGQCSDPWNLSAAIVNPRW